MKIAVVCPYSIDFPGGVQQQAIGLVDQIQEAGHEAWLVAPGTSGPSHFRLLGAAVRVRANGSVAPVAVRPGTARRTREAIAGADVVHVHEPLVFPTSTAAFLRTGRPAVGTFHVDLPPWVRATYQMGAPVLRRILARLAATTAVSPAAAAGVKALVGEVALIPNGVDVRALSVGGERHPHRVVFVGRDEPRKGLDLLLEAWPAVRTAANQAELVVIGANRPDPPTGVRYMGTVIGSAKHQQLAAAGVFCAPNLGGESFGISVVEAMAAGCIPVLSDLATFRQVAGSAARYFPVGDVKQLAAQIIAALQDRAGTKERRDIGQEMAAIYDWGNVFPEYLALYERCAQ